MAVLLPSSSALLPYNKPLFPGESGVDQLVEIIKVLGTPTREEIKCMNPNYTEFRFPQIKPRPWHKEPVVATQVAFQGVGRTLGRSPDDAAADANVAVSTTAPSGGLVLDSSLPSTSIQLRLADGTRMIAHFNNHHTVADIRGFINASRPDGPRAYQLLTVGFPPKPLTDPHQTIEHAVLANSVVIQKT